LSEKRGNSILQARNRKILYAADFIEHCGTNREGGGTGRVIEISPSRNCCSPSGTFRMFEFYPGLVSSIGLDHLISSFDLSKNKDDLKGPRRYGEIIASRWRLSPMNPELFPVSWKERVFSGEVLTPMGNIELHTTHIPPGSVHGWVKIEILEGIYKRLARRAEVPRILCGDFNAPQEERPDGLVLTRAQRFSARGEVQYRKYRGERWEQKERNILLGLVNFDLLDVYRNLHGYAVQE